MASPSGRSALTASLILLGSLVSATPAFAGPPWISIELPANPFNPSTRDAFCMIRVYHHGDPASFPVSGTAEGLVRGERKSVKLEIGSTSLPGVYALKFKPQGEGAWLLVVTMGKEQETGNATALITIGKNGELAGVRVPTGQRNGYLMPLPVSSSEVEAMLRSQVAAAPGVPGGNVAWLAGLSALVILPFGLRLRNRK